MLQVSTTGADKEACKKGVCGEEGPCLPKEEGFECIKPQCPEHFQKVNTLVWSNAMGGMKNGREDGIYEG